MPAIFPVCPVSVRIQAKGVAAYGVFFRPDAIYALGAEAFVGGVSGSRQVKSAVGTGDPVIIGYSPKTVSIMPHWKEIARSSFDNSLGSGPATVSLSITHSSEQSSEFDGDVEFTGDVKAFVLAQIGAKAGFGMKETRLTDEAVGISGSVQVPAHATGSIVAYYEGVSADGTATMRQYASPREGYCDYTVPVGAVVFPQALRVNFVVSTN